MNLSKNVKITRIATAQAAGTGAINSDSVDMQGFEGVLFVVSLGTVVSGAATSINAAQSADDSSFADLLGSSVTIADDDDDELKYLDIYQPGDRWVRLEVARATQNSTIDSVVAYQYSPLKAPVTQPTGTEGEFHGPATAEGTA